MTTQRNDCVDPKTCPSHTFNCLADKIQERCVIQRNDQIAQYKGIVMLNTDE